MRTHGTLTKWNDERGYGFVVLPSSGIELFVHISSFPKDGTRPRVGEMLAFDIERGADGRNRAVNVARPGARAPVRNVRRRSTGTSPALLAAMLSLLVAGAVVASRDQIPWLQRVGVPGTEREAADTAEIHSVAEESFRCDGRTRCNQMTSCEEATFFLRHCPNTRMDGDGDGIPREQQWCNN
jgi:cold shock CspA family protein